MNLLEDTKLRQDTGFRSTFHTKLFGQRKFLCILWNSGTCPNCYYEILQHTVFEIRIRTKSLDNVRPHVANTMHQTIKFFHIFFWPLNFGLAIISLTTKIAFSSAVLEISRHQTFSQNMINQWIEDQSKMVRPKKIKKNNLMNEKWCYRFRFLKNW